MGLHFLPGKRRAFRRRSEQRVGWTRAVVLAGKKSGRREKPLQITQGSQGRLTIPVPGKTQALRMVESQIQKSGIARHRAWNRCPSGWQLAQDRRENQAGRGLGSKGPRGKGATQAKASPWSRARKRPPQDQAKTPCSSRSKHRETHPVQTRPAPWPPVPGIAGAYPR